MTYGVKNGLISNQTKWPNATVPYFIDEEFGKNVKVRTRDTLICSLNF